MALVARGRSGGDRTRHIDIRYFWVKDRVQRGEAVIIHKETRELYANILTKPLQGGQFRHERACLTGWPSEESKGVRASVSTVRFDLSGVELTVKERKMKRV
jgi:uncharacterized protein YheU (UPF0270 family)